MAAPAARPRSGARGFVVRLERRHRLGRRGAAVPGGRAGQRRRRPDAVSQRSAGRGGRAGWSPITSRSRRSASTWRRPTTSSPTTLRERACERCRRNSCPAPPHATEDLKAKLPLANVKPRLRMTTLYFVANTLNYMVAGTGNRSELSIGYFTKYGDGGVDLLPIGDLLKSEVRTAAQELGVPDAGDRQGAERRALARPDRRSGDGLHLRGARELPDERGRNGLAGAGDADRAADAHERAQAGAGADAWSEAHEPRFARRKILCQSRILLAGSVSPAGAQQPAIQTPEQFFGFRMGTDNKLARWDKIVDYFKQVSRRDRTASASASSASRPTAIRSSRSKSPAPTR